MSKKNKDKAKKTKSNTYNFFSRIIWKTFITNKLEIENSWFFFLKFEINQTTKFQSYNLKNV